MDATAVDAWRRIGLVQFLRHRWLSVIVHLGAWMPLVVLVWRWNTDDLGADPVNTINNVTGRTALILLFLSLACTPAYVVFGFRTALTVSRALGLYAFLYALLHFANFAILDYALDVRLALMDGVLEKPYIFVGLTSLLLLIPLAVTSTRGWMRRLGKNWKRLHRLVYVIGSLVALHFVWQAKAAEKWEPLAYAAVLLILLVVRVPPIRRRIVNARLRLTRPSTALRADRTLAPARAAQHPVAPSKPRMRTDLN